MKRSSLFCSGSAQLMLQCFVVACIFNGSPARDATCNSQDSFGELSSCNDLRAQEINLEIITPRKS